MIMNLCWGTDSLSNKKMDVSNETTIFDAQTR